VSFDELKLSEADIEIIDGDRGVNYPKQNEFYDIGYCLFLNAKNVTKDGFDFNEKSFISREKDNLLRKGKLVRNDIVLTSRGTVGNVAFYNNRVPFNNIRINSGMVILRAKQSEYLPEFVYWMFRSNYIQDQINALKTGSAQPQLPITIMRTIKVLKPKLCEQKVIAATLSALDDMIELNNQINKTLEEMAQAIFKSWFVDFEPFRDGEFEESELGLIPKGWKVGMLGDFVEIVDNRGKTPPLSDVKTEYPIIDVRALSGESRVIDYSNCTKYVEKEIYDSWFRSGHPKHLDILISTVGSIAEMKMFYGNKGCIAQNVVAFRSNGISPCYLYQYLQYSKGDLLSYNIGSVQPSIKVTHVIKYKIIVPDEKTMSSFDMLMESISDQIHRNANESQILIAIRDTLLPKLISGEIRVPVEEVV